MGKKQTDASRLVDDLLDSASLLYDEIGELTHDFRDTLEWIEDKGVDPKLVKRMGQLNLAFTTFRSQVAKLRLVHDNMRIHLQLPPIYEP